MEISSDDSRFADAPIVIDGKRYVSHESCDHLCGLRTQDRLDKQPAPALAAATIGMESVGMDQESGSGDAPQELDGDHMQEAQEAMQEGA